MLLLGLPSSCLASAAAAELQCITHALSVSQKAVGPQNSTYFTKYGERCHEAALNWSNFNSWHLPVEVSDVQGLLCTKPMCLIPSIEKEAFWNK